MKSKHEMDFNHSYFKDLKNGLTEKLLYKECLSASKNNKNINLNTKLEIISLENT